MRVLVWLMAACGADLPPTGTTPPPLMGDLGEPSQPPVDLAGLSGSQCHFWPLMQSIGGIVGSRADDLFALTRDGKLVHSINRFATQTEVATPTGFNVIGRSSAGTLFGGREGGLYRSPDGGQTWSGVALPGLAGSVHAFSDGAVYLFGGDGPLMVSRDDGQSWSIITPPRPSQVGGVYASGSEVFVVGNEMTGGGYTGAVAHSSDGGVHWSSVSVDGIISAIWGSSPDDVYLVGFVPAGGTVHRSTDHGNSWTELTTSSETFQDVGGSGSRVYIVTSSKAMASDDHGATWSDICTWPSSPSSLWADPDGGALVPTGNVVALLP
jgi:photosystem II stability/assembly factor-like uncharacterized protein